MAEALLLRGARVIDAAASTDAHADVLVAEGRIDAVGPGLDPKGAEVLDCRGLVLAPGLVDLHTHLREPGFEYKETIVSGTRAAAAGGFTAVSSMANTDPVTDHAGIVAEIRDKAADAGLADVLPVGAITKGLAGESMAELGEMVEAGVRVFSDDGNCVPTARMLRNALVYAKAFPAEIVIADHCEDPSLVTGGHMHEGVHSSSLGLAGRPAEAEEIVVARDLAIARASGGRIHICHVSGARAVELIRRAKDDGVRVTAEVTPHHLVFTDDDLVGYDTNFKVNPPLRTAEDREALRCRRRRRHDRRDRHRPCAARGGGEGVRVRSRTTGHDRPGDRPGGRAHPSRRSGRLVAASRGRGDVGHARPHPGRRRARRGHRGGRHRRTSWSSTRPSDGSSSRRSRRRLATAPSPATSSPAGSGTRCSGGSSPSPTGKYVIRRCVTRWS